MRGLLSVVTRTKRRRRRRGEGGERLSSHWRRQEEEASSDGRKMAWTSLPRRTGLYLLSPLLFYFLPLSSSGGCDFLGSFSLSLGRGANNLRNPVEGGELERDPEMDRDAAGSRGCGCSSGAVDVMCCEGFAPPAGVGPP